VSPENEREILSAYRHLALTVIERAFRDVTTGVCSSAERLSAREFLAGSPIMQHWCRVAGLEPRRVITLASHLEVDKDKKSSVIPAGGAQTEW